MNLQHKDEPDDLQNVWAMRELVHTFGKIGLLSFGGPAAQISVMHRVLVDEKRWLSEAQFLHALSFCMLLPGPEAMQLATYAGWLMRGVAGGLLAGVLFVLPGLIMMLGLAWAYVSLGDVPFVAGAFFGLKAAVIAVVFQAVFKLSAKALGSAALVAIAVISFVGMFLFDVPFPLIVMAAAFGGLVLWWSAPRYLPVASTGAQSKDLPTHPDRRMALGLTAKMVLVWGGLWLAGLLFVPFSFSGGFETKAALFFSQVAVVSFGGAYAVLAYVAQQAVEVYGWLTAADMLTGLGLAETTLGPLVLVLVFVGFVGGVNASAEASSLDGLTGGLIAAVFTFLPCFVWIFAGAPHVQRLQNVRWLAASLSAVTAAVVGAIANLALWFALNVLFGPSEMIDAGWTSVSNLSTAQVNWAALAITVATGVALLGLKMRLELVLAAAALAGVAVRYLV